MTRKRALILCTGNSCRSQMAEAIWSREGSPDWEVHSAGSNPAGFVHPLAVQTMAEIDIDISANESQHLNDFVDQSFDVVVTVCDSAAQDCPVFANATEMLHWPFDDPSHVEGSDEEHRAAFRKTRELITGRIREYLSRQS